MTFTVDEVLFPNDNWDVKELEGTQLTPARLPRVLRTLSFIRKARRQLFFVCELTPELTRGKDVRFGVGDIAFESPAGSDTLFVASRINDVPNKAVEIGSLKDNVPIRFSLLFDPNGNTEVSVNDIRVAVLADTVKDESPLNLIEDIFDAGEVSKILIASEIEEIHSNVRQ